MAEIKCPKCGAQNIKNTKFCTKCGTKIDQTQDIFQDDNQEINCPKCSAKLPPNTRFCTDCGSKISSKQIYHNFNQEVSCPKCSVKLPANTRFCMECGAKIGRLNDYNDTNQKIICPNCSAKLPPNTRFCTDCGSKMGSKQIYQDSSQEVSCPKCFAKLPANLRFCTGCGAKIQQSSSLISDDTVNTVKKTGKNIISEVEGLFNKTTSKSDSFRNVSASNDNTVSNNKTNYERCLICEECGSYYEVEKDKSSNDLCKCGGRLKYQFKQVKSLN